MTWRLLEIKSASEKQFELCKALGYEKWNPKYAAQLQVYMGYAGFEDSVAVVYNKNTADIYIEKVRFDPQAFESLKQKATRILNQPPDVPLPRPAEGKSQYCGFCKWCARNQWCWSATADVRFAE